MKKILYAFMLCFGLISLFYSCQKEIRNVNNEEATPQSYLKNTGDINSFAEALEKEGIRFVPRSNNSSSSEPLTRCNPGVDSCSYLGLVRDSVSTPCKAEVTYDLWWCPGSNRMVIENFDVAPNFSDTSCGATFRRWNYLADSSTFSDWLISKDSFAYWASLEAEARAAKVFASFFGYNCPNALANTEFYRQRCYRTCFKLVWPPDPFAFKLTKIICGTSCCKRTRTFCINSNGDLEISNPVFEVHNGEFCEPAHVGGENCSGFLFGTCDQPCGPPQ